MRERPVRDADEETVQARFAGLLVNHGTDLASILSGMANCGRVLTRGLTGSDVGFPLATFGRKDCRRQRQKLGDQLAAF